MKATCLYEKRLECAIVWIFAALHILENCVCEVNNLLVRPSNSQLCRAACLWQAGKTFCTVWNNACNQPGTWLPVPANDLLHLIKQGSFCQLEEKLVCFHFGIYILLVGSEKPLTYPEQTGTKLLFLKNSLLMFWHHQDTVGITMTLDRFLQCMDFCCIISVPSILHSN